MRLRLAGWSSLINGVCHELNTINRTMWTSCSRDLGRPTSLEMVIVIMSVAIYCSRNVRQAENSITMDSDLGAGNNGDAMS